MDRRGELRSDPAELARIFAHPDTRFVPIWQHRCLVQEHAALRLSRDQLEQTDSAIEQAIGKVIDLTPRGIRNHLQLNKPIYARTAAYGHFGRAPEADGGFSWEKTDLTEALKGAV